MAEGVSSNLTGGAAKLRKITAILPTGGQFFGFPSSDPDGLDAAWKMYVNGFSAKRDRSLTGIPCGKDTSLKNAYSHMDEFVWESNDISVRKEEARKALKISEDCAEAYLVLAETEATTVEEAQELLRRGIEAGQRHLNKLEKDYLERNSKSGQLYTRPECQPYMRCRVQYANCIRVMGKFDEALMHYSSVADMNRPLDHLGVATCVIVTLLHMKRYSELIHLVSHMYIHNPGGVVPSYLFWTDALLTYLSSTSDDDDEDESSVDSPVRKGMAKMATAQAVDYCPLVLPFLLEEKPLPRVILPIITTGDESEAAAYVNDTFSCWKEVDGAIDFLRSCLEEGAGVDPSFAKDYECSVAMKEQGNQLFRLGEPQHIMNAVQRYATALRLCPDDNKRDRAVIMSNQAACLQKLEKYSDSLAMLDYAINIDPTYMKAYLRRAQAFSFMGKKDDAKKELEFILEKEPDNEAAKEFLKNL